MHGQGQEAVTKAGNRRKLRNATRRMSVGNAVNIIYKIKDALDFFKDGFAGSGWRDASAIAIEKGDTQLLFQFCDGSTKGWLRNIVVFCCY